MSNSKTQKGQDKQAENLSVNYTGGFSARLLSRARQHKPLYLISSMLQVVFGLLVVGISMLGLITPIWIAAIINVMGCIAVILGAYQLYDIFRENAGANGLVSEAMRDAINFRN